MFWLFHRYALTAYDIKLAFDFFLRNLLKVKSYSYREYDDETVTNDIYSKTEITLR